MIHVTRLDGERIVLNASLIEFIEATPDTLICMATGRKVMVRERVAEVVDQTVAYLQRIGHGSGVAAVEAMQAAPDDAHEA